MYNSVNKKKKQQRKPKDTDFFQLFPKEKEENFPVQKFGKRKNKTSSLEAYQNDAKIQCYAIQHNPRRPKTQVTFNLLKIFTVADLRTQWKKMCTSLLGAGIIAHGIREITRTKSGYPCNRIHYHFLIANDFSEKQLRKIFKDAALKAGLTPQKEFKITIAPIDEPEKLAYYFTKYKCPDRVILFKPKLGLQKYVTVGPYFIDEYGNKTTPAKIWKPINETGRKIHELKNKFYNYFDYLEQNDIRPNFKQYQSIIKRFESGDNTLEEMNEFYKKLEESGMDEYDYYLTEQNKTPKVKKTSGRTKKKETKSAKKQKAGSKTTKKRQHTKSSKK